jgi:arylsulfatase A-like enzyme
MMAEIGGPMTLAQIPAPWAWAMNAPFQWTKQVASHFGGTRNGMIVFWPRRIKPEGRVRSLFASVIAIAPMLYEAASVTLPREVAGARAAARISLRPVGPQCRSGQQRYANLADLRRLDPVR